MHHQSVQHTGKKKKRQQQQYLDLNLYMWGCQGSCSRVLMCLAGWDHMVENWVVGVLQYMNTFRSLARQRQTAHLLGSVGPTVSAGRYSRYVCVCTISEMTAACMVPSLAESPQDVVQCSVQNKCLAVAQYYDVKNIFPKALRQCSPQPRVGREDGRAARH